MVNPENLRIGDALESPDGVLFHVGSIDGDFVHLEYKGHKYGAFKMYGKHTRAFWAGSRLMGSLPKDATGGGGPQEGRPARQWANQVHGDQTSIPGLSPDAPTTVNAAGGKQSAVPYRADLIPARAILQVSSVLHTGALKYGDDNWHVIPTRDHLNHALTHVFAHLAGDAQDDHLGHAATRLLMALEIEARTTGNNGNAEKDPIH